MILEGRTKDLSIPRSAAFYSPSWSGKVTVAALCTPRTSTADSFHPLLPACPSPSSEMWLWDSKTPSKMQLQDAAPEEHTAATQGEKSQARAEPEPSQAENPKQQHCAMWMIQLSAALSISGFHWSLGMGNAGHRRSCSSCVCLGSCAEPSWSGEHLLCEKCLLFCVLWLLIFLLLLWVSYSIAVVFQKIVVSTHSLSAFALSHQSGVGGRRVAYLKFKSQVVVNHHSGHNTVL